MPEIGIRIIFFLLVISCSKPDCYDGAMKRNHSGICPQDCPSVCGCDGKTYCNECIANSNGITVAHTGACP